MGLEVFEGIGLPLRAALRVFRANSRDAALNEGGRSLAPGRGSKTPRDLFGVMVKDVLVSSFQHPTLVDETPSRQSPLRWLGQSVSHGVVL